MTELLLVLGTAVFCFAIIRSLFGFLAWLFPEADDLYRAKLDAFFDLLDRYSVFEIGRLLLQRLIARVRQVFTPPLRAYAVVGIFSLLLNAGVFIVASTQVIDSYLWEDSGADAVIWALERSQWLDVLGLVVLVAALGAVFDLASLAFTLYLLGRASLAARARVLVEHLFLDIVVAALSCLWAYVIFDVMLRAYYTELRPLWDEFTGGSADDYIRPTLAETLEVSAPLWYAVILLGISVALPTLAYLVAILPVLSLRVMPRLVQRVLSRIVYLITTDRQPVLKQLAAFSSGAGGLAGAVIAWVRFMPQ